MCDERGSEKSSDSEYKKLFLRTGNMNKYNICKWIYANKYDFLFSLHLLYSFT